MVEVHLTLDFEAMRALASGEQLAAKIESEDMVVIVSTTPETVEQLEAAAMQAVLMMTQQMGPKH